MPSVTLVPARFGPVSVPGRSLPAARPSTERPRYPTTRWPRWAWLGIAILLLAGAPAGAGAARTLQVGEEDVLALPGNPGTGYQWEFNAGASVNPQIVEVVAVGYRPAAGGRIGAPSEYVFHIRALAPGKAALTFHYRRPWEDEPPLRREDVAVAISR